MSAHTVGFDTLAPVDNRYLRVASRLAFRTVSIIVAVTGKVGEEVVYMLREDFAHGRIRRDPKERECD
jgi:hypothetical protein